MADRRAGETEQGYPIVADVEAAFALGPNVALVGVATQGGRFPPAWRKVLRDCVERGISIENGLHEFIGDDPELAPLAATSGATLTDLRRPPEGLDVPTGRNLKLPGKIVLTVPEAGPPPR